MSINLTSQEIARKYNRFASWYDLIEGVPDMLWVRRLRRRLLRRASGRVLEVAVGTGKNLHHYTQASKVIGVDLSPGMLAVARKRGRRLPLNVYFSRMDAETLGFPDGTFDTVVSSLTTCTFPNPAAALQEMARVCRPEGSVLLLEHGRSDREWLGRWQDRRDDRHAKQLGCHWNREPLELVREAGLSVISARRTFFGVFHEIEARL